MISTIRLSAGMYLDELFTYDSPGQLIAQLWNRLQKAFAFLLASSTLGYIAMTLLLHPLPHHLHVVNTATKAWSPWLPVCVGGLVFAIILTCPAYAPTHFIEGYTRYIALAGGLLLSWPAFITGGFGTAIAVVGGVVITFTGATASLQPLTPRSDDTTDPV